MQGKDNIRGHHTEVVGEPDANNQMTDVAGTSMSVSPSRGINDKA